MQGPQGPTGDSVATAVVGPVTGRHYSAYDIGEEMSGAQGLGFDRDVLVEMIQAGDGVDANGEGMELRDDGRLVDVEDGRVWQIPRRLDRFEGQPRELYMTPGRMWDELTTRVPVSTQAELDRAVQEHGQDRLVRIDVDAPAADRLKIQEDVQAVVHARAQSWVAVSGAARVRGHDSATVEATDSVSVLAMDESTVWAYDSSSVLSLTYSRVFAHDTTEVVARGQSTIRASDHARIDARDACSVVAVDQTQVTATDFAGVRATTGTHVMAYARSHVVGDEVERFSPLSQVEARHLTDHTTQHETGPGAAVPSAGTGMSM